MTKTPTTGQILHELETAITAAYQARTAIRADLERLNQLTEDGGTLTAEAAESANRAFEYLMNASAALKSSARQIEKARRAP